MTIDSKIKQQLEDESAEIDRILNNQDDEGLLPMLASGFKGSMRKWFILINVITLLITGALFWCGYQFFIAESETQLFWGVLFIVCFQLQISAKQWIANEMNRSSLMREIKRLELAVCELSDK